MNPKELIEFDKRLTSEFQLFCKYAPLMIKDKEGQIIPLKLNRAQQHIDNEIERMRREVGFVRVLILKGRQQGSSTYVGGRFMWKSVRIPGTNVYILAHDGDTTSMLFEMAKLYHELMTDSLRPSVSHSNRKELVFDKLKSLYRVGTAGNKEGGRGGTVRLFHGSEVGFWKNTDEITAGVLQSVPLAKDTEIILESTANGMGNMFYDMSHRAMKGQGLYRLIFVPWHWQDEYWLDAPIGFKHTEEELELRDTYDLSPGQINWRRMKIEEFTSEGRDGKYKFKQEYPFNAPEAFQTSGDSLVPSEYIYRARKSAYNDPSAPVIFGVDPSGTGKDRAVLVIRQGRKVLEHVVWDDIEPMHLVGKLALYANKYKPLKIFIDYSHGYAVCDRLKELGYKMTQHIHFKESADEDDIYANKRAEMWMRVLDWFKQECNIPDDDQFQGDIQCMPQPEDDSNSRIKMVSKEKIKKLYKKSPDIGDALALTFARKVRKVTGNSASSRVVRKGGFQSRRDQYGRG